MRWRAEKWDVLGWTPSYIVFVTGLSHIETTIISSQGKSCLFNLTKTHDQNGSHYTNILTIIVIIFYTQTKNNKYTELSKFKTEIISSKGKSCDFRSIKTHN